MMKLTKLTKLIIALTIIVLSTYLGIKRSNIVSKFKQSNKIVIDKETQKTFDDSGNFLKCVVKFRVEDFDKVDKKINEIKKDVSILSLDASPIHKTLIIEIPNSKYDEILAKIKAINGLFNEKMVNNFKENRVANIEEKVQNRDISKNRIKDLITKSSTPERVKLFTNQLEAIQTKIDSLESLFSVQKHNKENSTVMLAMVTKAKNEEMRVYVKSLFMNTLTVLFIITLFFFIFYYFTVLMLKLMKLVGIKNAKSSRSAYIYRYNYGGKSYGNRVRIKKAKAEEKDESDQKK